MSQRHLVAGHLIIASTQQLWQTWRRHQPSRLADGWRVWALSGKYGIQPSPIEYHSLERRQIETLAALVADQWNVNVAASVVMAGSAPYQELAVRAHLNVVERIEGRHIRHMRRLLVRWATQNST